MNNVYDIFTGRLLIQKWYDAVKERVEARFGDKLPVHFKSLMASPQKHPYMHGCAHGLKKQRHSKLFNTPIPVPCEVLPSVSVLKATAEHGDPFMWMDLKYRCSYNHIIQRQGQPLSIETRSDLIAHDDYVNVLDIKNHSIVIILGKGSEEQVRYNEPGAPSNKRRLSAYEKLKSLGFNVSLKNNDKIEPIVA